MARLGYISQGRFIISGSREDIAEQLRRSNHGAPNIILDGMDYVMNHADGKRYTSKRAYERAVRAAGCVITGNEDTSKYVKRQESPSDIKDDIRRAIAELS